MATAKIQTQGFKPTVHKPIGDVMDAMSILTQSVLSLRVSARYATYT